MASITLLLFLIALFFVCSFSSGVVVPSGSHVASVGKNILIRQPDGSSVLKPLSVHRPRDTNDNGWIAAINTAGNYTYFSAEWDVPPFPTNTWYNNIYFKNSFQDIPVTGILQAVLSFYDDQNGNAGWQLYSSYAPLYGYTYVESERYNANVGDHIRGVIELVGGYWVITGYVNGVQKTQLYVPYANGVYISFEAVDSPTTTVATTTDTAAQSFLTVYPFNATKTAGRLFTFSSDGYISLTTNPNLVLDVNGGTASEGARVLVYPKKSPVAQNQQWTVLHGVIYSKLAGGVYALSVTSDNKVVLTKTSAPKLFIGLIPTPDNPFPTGISQLGTAQFVLEVYNVWDCAQYPPTNRLDASGFVLKKGATTVTPTWVPGITPSTCNVTITSTSSTATVKWNSTTIN